MPELEPVSGSSEFVGDAWINCLTVGERLVCPQPVVPHKHRAQNQGEELMVGDVLHDGAHDPSRFLYRSQKESNSSLDIGD